MLTLLIGGARSGKSKVAESLCGDSTQVAYIATAQIEDEEMRDRVARHRRRRPAHWITIEEPLALDAALCRVPQECEFVLVDCLTVWLSNLLYQYRRHAAAKIEELVLAQVDQFLKVMPASQVILVSNEVGGGLVPTTKLGRLFRDLQGFVNQRVAAEADRVLLVVAGIPVQIKPAR